MDLLNIQKINSETIPEVAKLGNQLVKSAFDLLNQTISDTEKVLADTLTQSDAIGNRLLDRLELLVKSLECGLELNGSVGGIPIQLTLTVKDK